MPPINKSFKRIDATMDAVVLTASATVDITMTNTIIVLSPNPVTVTLDCTKAAKGKRITIAAFAMAQSGSIILVANLGVAIQKSSSTYLNSVNLALDSTNRVVELEYNGSNLDNKSNTRFAEELVTTNANLDNRVDQDTFTDETNKPAGQIPDWPWQRLVIRLKQISGLYTSFRTELAFHAKSGAGFERHYDGQTSTFSAWFRLHTNRWFKVDETMTPATGDLFYYDDREIDGVRKGWTRLPKGADGTSLKMVGGLPTWVA